MTLFSCCENQVGIYKNAKAAFDKSSSKTSNIFFVNIKSLQNKFFAWNHNQFALFDSSVTQSKVMYNQSSSQSPASVAAAKEDSIILHAIALYFPLAHYEFSSSIVSLCNLYVISSPPRL